MNTQLIQPAEVVRDENGAWHHPDIPSWVGPENADRYYAWLKEQGLVVTWVQLADEHEEHPAYIAYFEQDSVDYSAWNPPPPSGDGWFTLAIADTEDGPAYWWARRASAEAERE